MADDGPVLHVEHTYENGDERCTYCGVNVYDAMMYGPETCTPYPSVNYTTETPKKVPND